MRISDAARWAGYSERINAAQARLVEYQSQAADGKRIRKPSDDPPALGRVLDVRAYSSAISGYRDNLTRAENLLKTSEATLGDVGGIAQRAYSIAVSAANSVTDQNARAALATEVEDLQKRLVGLANAKAADGTALFAGQMSDRSAYTVDAATGGLTYSGDLNLLQVESGPGVTTPASVDASRLLTTLYDRLTRLKDSLRSGDVAGLGDARLGELKESSRATDLVRGQVGAGLQTIAAEKSAQTRRLDDLTRQASDIEDVDLAEALVRYQQANTAYQAALQVTSQASRLSLMDYMR